MSAAKLSPEQLTCPCEESSVVRSPLETRPPKLPGQTRGMDALTFGMAVKERRFNITVVGSPGSGKTTTVRRMLDDQAATEPPGQDVCLHQNFVNPHQPRVLTLPPGGGRKVNRLVDELLSVLDKQIPKLLEQPVVKARLQDIRNRYSEEQQRLSHQLEQRAQELGLVMQPTQQGVNLVPLTEGRPMREEEYFSLGMEERQQIEERRKQLIETMSEVNPRLLTLESRKREELETYIERLVHQTVAESMDQMRRLIQETPALSEFLDQLVDEITDKRFLFLSETVNQPFGAQQLQVMRQQFVKTCKLNVLVDRSQQTHAPVVMEINPTYTNLIGGIDYTEEHGVLKADFTQIRAGSLIQADGGYLVLQATDLLQNPLAYTALKRALRAGKVQIQDPLTEMGWRSVSHLEARPVEIRTRVVLVGDEYLIHLLRTLDDEFSRLFKITADFSGTLVRTPEVMEDYVRYLEYHAHDNGLRRLSDGALARMIEESSRVVSHQNRLSAQMTELVDILIEADHHAAEAGQDEITREAVHTALERRKFRASKIEEVVRREISEGTILLDHTGSKPGQVNGLAVYQTGRNTFGVPTRITAQAYAGRAGVINIEREAELSGRIHTKGVLILNGYLGRLFARRTPLALAVSITLEQTYGYIEGDSATSAEFYAIVSAISGVPLKQNIAVTGSLNQHGEVQPIGGVNEKVVGFFRFMQEHDFPEGCGAIIPAKNQVNLMLPDEVIDAVQEDKFAIHAVERAEDGLEVMTGQPAGELQPDGSFPDGTVYGRTMAQLQTFSQAARDLQRGAGQGDPPG